MVAHVTAINPENVNVTVNERTTFSINGLICAKSTNGARLLTTKKLGLQQYFALFADVSALAALLGPSC